MKNFFTRLLSIVLLLCCTIAMNSCSDDEEPKNEINDAEGLQIDLTWTTGGTDADAIRAIDIDIKIYNGEQEVMASTSGSRFEELFIYPELPDGEYRGEIVLFSTSASGSFELSIAGSSVSKKYVMEENFGPGEYTILKFVTITKSGSKYTMKPIER